MRQPFSSCRSTWALVAATAVLAACGGGNSGTSSTGEVPASSSGSTTGAAASSSGSGGAEATSSGSSAGTGTGSGVGATSGGSGTGGASTGAFLDAGCGPKGELTGCAISADCQCPLSCLFSLCLKSCGSSVECPKGETCLPSGACFGLPVCSPDAGVGEFQACTVASDCSCPLNCFGGVCEHACTLTSECAVDAGQFCEGDAGSCWLTPVCNPAAGATEFQPCAQTSDCECPFACVVDPRRGAVCELPCTSGATCASDEICEGDAGVCQRTSNCFGGDGGLPEFTGCGYAASCACPLSCVVDPRFAIGVGPALCEQCNSPTDCAPPGGACVDAGPLAAAAQVSPDPVLWTPCASNADCDCPNQCLPVAGGGSFACQLSPPTCLTAADCADPSQTCLSGGCVPNLCLSSAVVGQPCDVAFGQDNPVLTGDGACLPNSLGGPTLLCVQGGKGLTTCSLKGDRTDPNSLCPTGSICVASPSGNFCAGACQIGGLPGCGKGQTCEGVNPAYPNSCPACVPPLYALQACLPSGGLCADDLPTFTPSDGPFDSSAVGIPFAPCATDNCLCPASCTYDFFLGSISYDATSTFCESSCLTGGDCPWPQTYCNGGVCALDRSTCTVAVPGGAASTLGASCTNAGSTGTCVYFSPFVQQPQPGAIFTAVPVALCRVDGTAISSCDPTAQRGSNALCGAGTDCLPLGDGGYACLSLCDPLSDAGSCGGGEACVRVTHFAGGIDEGTCVHVEDAGCADDLPPAKFAPCRSSADCACGLVCAVDPNLPIGAAWTSSTKFCEQPCTAAADCSVDEVCLGESGKRTCRMNLCADAYPMAQTCNADTVGGGTCLAQAPAVSALPFAGSIAAGTFTSLGLCGSEPALGCIPGLCQQAGMATGACDPAADRSSPDLLCVPGAICDTSGPTPMCTSLCNLPNAGQCPAGEYCRPLPGNAAGPGAVNLQGECLPAMGVDAGS